MKKLLILLTIITLGMASCNKAPKVQYARTCIQNDGTIELRLSRPEGVLKSVHVNGERITSYFHEDGILVFEKELSKGDVVRIGYKTR